MPMIKKICTDKALRQFTCHQLEDAGIEIKVDENLKEEEYIGIKVDDYYNHKGLGGETPKAVDFVVVVDCQCNAYVMYILELKNVKKPGQYTTKSIHEKFSTTINRFIKNEFKEIFLADQVKYKDIKLYLVTKAYQDAMKHGNYDEYCRLMLKMNKKDTLNMDMELTSKPFIIRGQVLHIKKEIPPNPIIRRIYG